MKVEADLLARGKAHLELVLLDSRIYDLPREGYLRRWSAAELPEELTGALDRLYDETRACGGHLIHIGRVILAKLGEFLDQKQDFHPSMVIAAFMLTLREAVPVMGPIFEPVTTFYRSIGLADTFDENPGRKYLRAEALGFLSQFIEILRPNQEFFVVPEEVNPELASFEDFLADHEAEAHDPFALDELAVMDPSTRLLAKYLVKMGLTQGDFDAAERELVKRTISDLGYPLSDEQIGELAAEASGQALDEILTEASTQVAMFKENMLYLGMLCAASDGSVDAGEKRLLAESLSRLGISKERYNEIARNAVSLIRSKKARGDTVGK